MNGRRKHRRRCCVIAALFCSSKTHTGSSLARSATRSPARWRGTRPAVRCCAAKRANYSPKEPRSRKGFFAPLFPPFSTHAFIASKPGKEPLSVRQGRGGPRSRGSCRPGRRRSRSSRLLLLRAVAGSGLLGRLGRGSEPRGPRAVRRRCPRRRRRRREPVESREILVSTAAAVLLLAAVAPSAVAHSGGRRQPGAR